MKNYIGFWFLFQAFVVQADDETPKKVLCGYKGGKLARTLYMQGRLASSRESFPVSDDELDLIRNHPWQVAVVTRDKKHQCGGTIISNQLVLTAAHCFFVENLKKKTTEAVSPDQRLIVVSSATPSDYGLYYTINKIQTHENYGFSRGGFKNDIAVVKIEGEFIWTITVFPICLPAITEVYKGGRPCIISGYGQDAFSTSNVALLKYGEVELQSDEECKKDYGGNNITGGMFCAAGYAFDGSIINTCNGDSGGPLYCESQDLNGQYFLLGVSSFGAEKNGPTCPGVYSKITFYHSWIKNQMKNLTATSHAVINTTTSIKILMLTTLGNLLLTTWL